VTGFISRVKIQKNIAIAVVVLVLGFGAGSLSLAQMAADNGANQGGYQTGQDKPMPGQPMPQQAMPERAGPDQSMPSQPLPDQNAPVLSESELENLVAPIALYPDALLSQVLVASTYPLEIVEAQQWLQQNGNLRNRELMEAARQQNWDASVQALVAFPDVVALLNRDIRWTTDLGNAFLGQQADVMNAIQNLRAEARENGRLRSTPQFAVNTETQGQQSAIEIQPADPQRMYVPNYDPYAVWGAPAEGDYPALPYASGSGFGSFFGTVANLAGLLPGFGGLLGPRSWGWALSWLAQALFVNNSFFSDFGFHGGGFRGSSVWVHDVHHRLGVPYGNGAVASRYGRQGEGWGRFGGRARGVSGADGRGASAPYRSGGESFSRGNFQRGNSGSGWRTFGGGERTASAGQSGRTFSQASRASDRGLQANRGVSEGFGSSRDNRERSFTGSRSFGSGSSRYNGFGSSGTVRGTESSRTFAANRSRADAGHFSGARMPAERGGSFGRGESGHGFSSHAPKSHAPKFHAPKVAKSHFSKPHGGGHSSGGHGGKRSHRG
jgi:hypothetical protein